MSWQPPQLKSLTPTHPTASGSPQVFAVKGCNFHQGLVCSSGTASAIGANKFTWTVTQASAATIHLVVTNTDAQSSNALDVTFASPPVSTLTITCPGSQSAVSSDGNPVSVSWPPATASGGNGSLVIRYTINGQLVTSPATLGVGSYMVVATVTDNGGATQSCSFAVSVTHTPVTPSGPVLSQSDFTFLGYYDVPHDLYADMNYGQGFTHRYVSGQLRFLTMSYYGGQDIYHSYPLVEMIPPAGFSSQVTLSRTWADPMGGGLSVFGRFAGLWWEEAHSRLWVGEGIDYPDDTQAMLTVGISTRTLVDDGTVSNVKGEWGFANISQRRLYGGVQPVPAAFQSTYGVGAYCCGWGGYASRGNQGVGGGASLGPTMYFMADPSAQPPGNITGQTAMDCVAGWASPWYPAQTAPSSFDRGVRNSSVAETFDLWTSPSPDGLGRWTWGDSHYNTGCWINGTNKQGFLLVPSFASGNAWYQSSTLNCDGRNFEIHIYDPAQIGAAVLGSVPIWNVKPTNRWVISLAGMGGPRVGNGPFGNVAGATFDATTNKLYLYGTYLDGATPNNRIYVYQVTT